MHKGLGTLGKASQSQFAVLPCIAGALLLPALLTPLAMSVHALATAVSSTPGTWALLLPFQAVSDRPGEVFAVCLPHCLVWLLAKTASDTVLLHIMFFTVASKGCMTPADSCILTSSPRESLSCQVCL